MNTRIIKKHILNFDKVIPYVIDRITCDRELSKKILEKIDFKNGSFFTILPEDARIEKIYEFKWGGIIPSIPFGTKTYKVEGVSDHFHPQQVITTDRDCAKIVTKFLNISKKNYALVEDYNMEPDSPHVAIENVKMVPFHKEVYYLLNEKNSEEDVYITIRGSNIIWHFLMVLMELDQPISSTLNQADFDRICEKTKFVIIGAYDGEGYVFWEKQG